MDNKTTSSFHLVRQYGKQGGMENYVWELTHALARKGHEVSVVCEKAHRKPSAQINVVELGLVKPKPRWISQLKYSKKVTDFFDALAADNHAVIHSHERAAVHQVTTIHGPSILNRKKKLFDFLSLRLRAWEFLERREVVGPSVSCVFPNSKIIANELLDFYPQVKSNLCLPAYPGVAQTFHSIQRYIGDDVIGFMGREWKRKGLEVAVDAFKRVLKTKQNVRFLVAGMPPEEVSHLFKDIPINSYELLGWQKPEEFLSRITVLIHPAYSEPFGMVVAEANAVGIPVLVSSKAGVADLVTENNGYVLDPDSKDWPSKLIELMAWGGAVEPMNLSWDALADQCVDVYRKLSAL